MPAFCLKAERPKIAPTKPLSSAFGLILKRATTAAAKVFFDPIAEFCEIWLEGEGDGSDGAVTLLANDDFGFAV